MKMVSILDDGDDDSNEGGSMSPGVGYCCPDGISLYLDSETVEALGITKGLPVGTVVSIQALAIVTDSSEYLDSDGKDVSMGLRITDMGLERKGAMTAAEAAKKLYPDAA